MAAWVKDVDSLWDFIGYVVVRAPDRFPVEDFLPADEQMNLERAFVELRRGIALAKHDGWPESHVESLNVLLDQSLAAYRAGDDIKGAHLLQDFQDAIFKRDS